MIRLLTVKDELPLLAYLNQEPTYNIFFIGDIETFGFDKDFLRIYGEFNENGQLVSTLLRYRQSAIYYAHNLTFNEDYLDIFKRDPFSIISGKLELMNLIHPHLKGFRKKETFFCQVEKMDKGIKDKDLDIHVLSSPSDCEKLYDFMSTIEDFKDHIGEKATYVEGKMKAKQMGITLFIEKDNRIISTVATTAETKTNAMVVSVATDPKYRQQGLASKLLVDLMERYLIDKNKSLCLFYDNPEAGRIYHRLGFKTIGKWAMYFASKDRV